MAFAEIYKRQVALLIRVLPLVTEEACFALKGRDGDQSVRSRPAAPLRRHRSHLCAGRAPRPITCRYRRRNEAHCAQDPSRRSRRADHRGRHRKNRCQIDRPIPRRSDQDSKLHRSCAAACSNPTMKSVRPPSKKSSDFAEARIVSFADLYAGKIVAALDRQHPRDLFDVRDLLAAEGITEDLRQAFIVYLLSHDRPMSEVLAPTLANIESAFTHGFSGMTRDAIALADLLAARATLIQVIVGGMPPNHRKFLVSFERGDPQLGPVGIASTPPNSPPSAGVNRI